MRAHVRLTVAITLAAAMAFSTGCAPHEDWTTPVEAAWSVEARLLSAPLRAGDVVLAYVVGSAQQMIVLARE